MNLADVIAVIFIIGFLYWVFHTIYSDIKQSRAEVAYYTFTLGEFEPIINLDYRTKDILEKQALVDGLEYSVTLQVSILDGESHDTV